MDALAPLRSSPATTAIFLDFDGTLAPIVPAAEDARPLPGVPALLQQLHRAFGVVAIVSGRPVAFLVQHLPPELELHGLYGLEAVVGGEPTHHPEAFAWRAVVDEVASAAHAAGPPGVDVEHKGLSLTLHFRRRPEVADAARAWATDVAARSGLVPRPAKMSLELHPGGGGQGNGGGGWGGGDDQRLLRGRRRRRPARLRRPRPVGRAGSRHPQWPCAPPTRRRSCSAWPTSTSTAPMAPSPSSETSSRDQRAAASWSANQWAGVRASARARSTPARSARSAAGMVRASWRVSAVPATSKGGTRSAAGCRRSQAPASGTGPTLRRGRSPALPQTPPG